MRSKMLLFLSLFPSMVVANILPTDVVITVFTTKHYVIEHSEFAHHIYYLDSVENLEEKTAQLFGQNTTPAIAAKRAKQWLLSNEGKHFQQELQQAYIGVIEGWKMGIMKVPAIIFKQDTEVDIDVVYGITDIRQAIQLYREKKGR